MKVSGEVESADKTAAEPFKDKLDSLIINKKYLLKHTFNVDETSLFGSKCQSVHTSINNEKETCQDSTHKKSCYTFIGRKRCSTTVRSAALQEYGQHFVPQTRNSKSTNS